ncbi:hypothetical protein MLD38_019188 [Melastoma candidum]|uniref:Uncharacterized protein n=1 Tax=Melastoma candidum TaxID=119954 RepID=A0ACB9QVD1_9MYRT|nr:hypothetical protein MLD38_019188 [Melastoma candidum]
MESSEEEDDFPSTGSITPQSNIDSLYQSSTEKGIRKLCCELLDLKDSVEDLCGNTRTKYLAFLRVSEEVVEMKHELNELRKNISSQGIIVRDLMTGVCRELDDWEKFDGSDDAPEETSEVSHEDDPMRAYSEKMVSVENIDVLLAEHNVEGAVEALISEEKNSPELKGSTDNLSPEASLYRAAVLKRKEMVEKQLMELLEQPLLDFAEQKKALFCLIRLGRGPTAHQLFLKGYLSHLQRRIDVILPSSSLCPRIFSATLAKLIFSAISGALKQSGLIFGDDPSYTNRVVQWAEWEIEYFVRVVKENAPYSDTISALHAVSTCIQASLSYCSLLESQGLKLSKLLLLLLRPYVEEVLELNFRRARKTILDIAENEESLPVSPHHPLSAFAATSDDALIDNGLKFMYVVDELLDQLSPLAVTHFGVNILDRIAYLYDKYVDALMKALPGPSDDDNLADLKEVLPFRAETDAQKLALLGMAYTIYDELLPETIGRLWSSSNEISAGANENPAPRGASPTEMKEWRKRLQYSFDKLKDHFCRQYVLSFIYSREGRTRLHARIYLSGNEDDAFRNSDHLPSLPFQALFAKLQQLATVAGDVLLGKEKIQKLLLSRLTETVLIWLAEEQEFWSLFGDPSSAVQPAGLQQLILDMHFTIEIARFAGYQSRIVHQNALAVIARAISTFAARGIDPQSALESDEWFIETAKSAINKLLLGASGSDTSEIDEDHIIHDEINSDSASSISTIESVESFASASMGELESPLFTDPEN